MDPNFVLPSVSEVTPVSAASKRGEREAVHFYSLSSRGGCSGGKIRRLSHAKELA